MAISDTSVFIVTCMILRGYAKLEPFGSSHNPAGGVPSMGKFPSPGVFYLEFIRESRPVLMNKVLEHDRFDAYDLWTDTYLSNRYGDEMCEVKKHRDQISFWLYPMSLRQFINRYYQEEIFISQDVPDPMRAYIKIPLSLECGGFLNGLRQVALHFSGDRIKPRLQKDDLDNILCIMDGSQEIVMIDKRYASEVEADGWVKGEDYSEVDVTKVDLTLFPKLKNLPYQVVTVHKGYCLLIPQRWYWFVRSYKEKRNMALNFRFHHLHWFNMTDCERGDMDPFRKSSKSFGLYRFPKYENLDKLYFIDLFQDLYNVTRDDLQNVIERKQTENLQDSHRETLSKVFDVINVNSDDSLSWEEMYMADMEKVIEMLSETFTDPSTIYYPNILKTRGKFYTIKDSEGIDMVQEKVLDVMKGDSIPLKNNEYNNGMVDSSLSGESNMKLEGEEEDFSIDNQILSEKENIHFYDTNHLDTAKSEDHDEL